MSQFKAVLALLEAYGRDVLHTPGPLLSGFLAKKLELEFEVQRYCEGLISLFGLNGEGITLKLRIMLF